MYQEVNDKDTELLKQEESLLKLTDEISDLKAKNEEIDQK